MHPTRTRPRPRTNLVRGLAALLLVGAVAVGATACDPNQPADCTKDCLDFVVANEGGDGLNIYGLGGGITAEVTVYADAARTQVVGYAQTWSFLRYAMDTPITKAYQGLPVQNPAKVQLKPATTYWYAAKAHGAGGTWSDGGSFKTKQRTVTVTIQKISVYDDSDLAGSGELTFDLRANGGSAVRVYQDLNWSSGTARTVNFTKAYAGVMPNVTVQVRGQDDDCSFSTCTAPANRWDAVGGNGDTQWATATIQLNVPNKSGEGTSGTFLVNGGDGGGVGDLGFWVSGTWSVRYDYA